MENSKIQESSPDYMDGTAANEESRERKRREREQ
jgi:hypothetical protein